MEGNTNRISRVNTIAKKIVFIDGLPGCGKTLFSPIIATMDRVELLTVAYEIEHFCALSLLEKISLDAAVSMIKMKTDLQLYNTMMGRETNFRPTDLSSVMNNHNPGRYFQRLFQPGDEAIPSLIDSEHPILNLITHNLLPFSQPIWKALGERCVFVNVIRHPLYMIRQQTLNMQRLIGTARDFTVYFSYKDVELPYYVYGWEDQFLSSNPTDRVVRFIDNLTRRTKKVSDYVNDKYNAKIVTIPFEKFVLEPRPWLEQIAKALETTMTEFTEREMIKQKVPRQKIAQGIDLDIYRRCGWVPPTEGLNERDELNVRREDVVRDASNETISIIDRLCEDYEKEYWNPDQ
jgi:hypothetical protein